MPLRAIAFDWGHTLMDERFDAHLPLDVRPVHLMPGVARVLPRLWLPLAVWANTRDSGAEGVRKWLRRASLDRFFDWVITSVEAGARKPSAEFFRHALAQCGVANDEVLFVGNQLNTDIAGAAASGIRSVWLSGAVYRSVDDGPSAATPTYAIKSLDELVPLVETLVPRPRGQSRS